MQEDGVTIISRTIRPLSAIEFYFKMARQLELSDGQMYFLSDKAKSAYQERLHEVYDVLYDRVMRSRISTFLKQEVEQWYAFNRDFLGFGDTTEMNHELEGLLRRFELL